MQAIQTEGAALPRSGPLENPSVQVQNATEASAGSMLPVDLDGIPPTLRSMNRWLVWKAVPRPGRAKPSKVPHDARTGKPCDAHDPAAWLTFDAASTAYMLGSFDGIGFYPGAGIVGVDLDGCRDPATGKLSDDAAKIVAAVASYTEISPSGTGLRVFARGSLPPGKRRNGFVEMYDGTNGQGRPGGNYLSVTGHRLPNSPADVQEAVTALRRVYLKYIAAGATAPVQTVTGAPEPAPPAEDPLAKADDLAGTSLLTDEDLLAKARGANNGFKFSDLFDAGRLAPYEHDASRADLALCSMLAFWSGRDMAQMDRLFRQSALYREKWDEQRGQYRYGERTIRQAITKCQVVYAPGQADAPAPAPSPTGRTAFKFLALDELLAKPRPPKWLVHGILEENSLALLFGASGSMKSFMALALGLSVASGLGWAGRRVPRPGPVLYIAAEGVAGLPRRIQAWRRTYLPDQPPPPLFVAGQAPQMLDQASAAAVRAAVADMAAAHGPPRLVILDTVARSFGPGDENSNADMGKFIAAVDALREEFRAAVLLVHHSGHQERDRARGASALHAAMDFAWRLDIQGDRRVLTTVKSKDHEPLPPMAFTPVKIAVGWTAPETGEEIESVVLEHAGAVRAKTTAPLTGQTRLALDVLRELVASAGGPVTGEAWRAAYCARRDGSPDTRRKAFSRARDELLADNHVGGVDGCFEPSG